MTFFNPDILIFAVVICLPFAVAAAFLVARWRSALARLAPWAALPAVGLAVFVLPGVTVQIDWLLLGARFGMDPAARVFLFFTALIWLVCGVYAAGCLPEEKNRTRFFLCYLLAMSGNLGLILAQDAVSFYFFFALMSFAAYALVVHSGSPSARHAGKVYIILVVLGEAFVFFGITLAARAAGSVYFPEMPAGLAASPELNWIVGLVLIGFGIKAGALPLHVWLPLAHPAAPTPASAILSGAMIKAGLLGWIRLLPLGEAALPQWGGLVIAAGLLAAFYGVVAGLVQDSAKTVLAYSSVSQMGLMTAAVGAGLTEPRLWPYALGALVLYAAQHALAKAALFLSVGVTASPVNSRWMGMLRLCGLLLPALALAGAPFTGGAMAKVSLKYAMEGTRAFHPWLISFSWWLAAASVGTVLLVSRFVWLVWPDRAGPARGAPVKTGVYVSWAVMVASAALLPLAVAAQDFIKLPGQEAFFSVKPGGVWPVIIGAFVVAIVLINGGRKPFRIPEGDVLIFYVKGLSLLWTGVLFVAGLMDARVRNIYGRFLERCRGGLIQWKRSVRPAETPRTEAVFGVVFLLILAGFFLFLSRG